MVVEGNTTNAKTRSNINGRGSSDSVGDSDGKDRIEATESETNYIEEGSVDSASDIAKAEASSGCKVERASSLCLRECNARDEE